MGQHLVNIVDDEVRDEGSIVEADGQLGAFSREAEKLSVSSVTLSPDTAEAGELSSVARHDLLTADH